MSTYFDKTHNVQVEEIRSGYRVKVWVQGLRENVEAYVENWLARWGNPGYQGKLVKYEHKSMTVAELVRDYNCD